MSEKFINDFKVHVPVELIKSENKEGEEEWRIKGIASTGDVDLQGEEVFQDGLDLSVLKAGKGLFNNDHMAGPENILGEIENADLVDYDGKKALSVEGYLFKHQDRAKAYYNIMKSVKKGRAPRVHFSIEGKVVERDMAHTSRIKKARVTKVALTLDPVNTNTFANLVKSLNADNVKAEENFLFDQILEFTSNLLKEKINKAISAGVGYTSAPASRSGGEAMTTESMDGKLKKMLYKKLKKNKKINRKMIKSIIEVTCKALPDADPLEVSKMICKSYELKLKESLNVN